MNTLNWGGSRGTAKVKRAALGPAAGVGVPAAISVLLLVFGLALAGCGGEEDDGTDDTKKDTGSTELACAIHISEAPENADSRPAAAETDPGIKLYAVYSGNASPAYRWNKDGEAVSGATEKAYTPAEAGSYTVTVTSDGKSKTSAPVTVTAVTAATVSVGVDAWAYYGSGQKYTGYVDVTLTLSRGTWKSAVHNTSDTTIEDTFKTAAPPSKYNSMRPGLTVDAYNPRKVTCKYFDSGSTQTIPAEKVTVTLAADKLAALARYTTLSAPATLTAGNPSTASDSTWEKR